MATGRDDLTAAVMAPVMAAAMTFRYGSWWRPYGKPNLTKLLKRHDDFRSRYDFLTSCRENASRRQNDFTFKSS